MPKKIVASVMMRTMKRFGQVRAARQASAISLSTSSEALRSQAVDALKFMSHEPQIGSYFAPDNEAIKKIGGWQEVSRQMAASQVKSLNSILDAASLVFAHAFFEAAIMDLCRAVALTQPEAWEFAVADKKVSISDLKGRDYAQSLSLAIDGYFQKLERDPLPVKADRLIKVSRPSTEMLASEDYKYSRDRLVSIDELRHKVVHGEGPQELANLDSDLQFLETTAYRFAGGVIETYQLWPDPEQLLKEASENPRGTTVSA